MSCHEIVSPYVSIACEQIEVATMCCVPPSTPEECARQHANDIQAAYAEDPPHAHPETC